MQQHEVTLGHRLLDGRYEITGGVPDNAMVVTQLRSGLRAGRAAKISQRAEAMNLAYRDIKHNLLRFVLTNFGLSLLARHRHRDHRRLWRPDRRCAAAGARR